MNAGVDGAGAGDGVRCLSDQLVFYDYCVKGFGGLFGGGLSTEDTKSDDALAYTYIRILFAIIDIWYFYSLSTSFSQTEFVVISHFIKPLSNSSVRRLSGRMRRRW